MCDRLRIERDVKQPDGSTQTETIIIPVEPELADVLFRRKSGDGLDFLVTPEDGIRIVKHKQ